MLYNPLGKSISINFKKLIKKFKTNLKYILKGEHWKLCLIQTQYNSIQSSQRVQRAFGQE